MQQKQDNRAYTVDDALDVIGFGRFQWTLLLLSGFGFFATTVELILMSLIQVPLQMQWPELALSHRKLSMLQSSVFAGELTGGLIWGSLTDKLGRRGTFVGTAGMAALFGTLASICPSYWLFVLSRYFLGIAIGGSLSIDFIYFVEFVPSKSRGVRTIVIIFLGICAFFYASALSYIFLPGSWRLFVLACGMPNTIVFLGRLVWGRESPRFLLSQGRLEEAGQVLEYMARYNRTSLPPGQLVSLDSVRETQGKATSRPWYSTYTDIWQSGLLVPVTTISMLFFGQTFGYYGLTNWIRKLIVSKGIQGVTPAFMFIIIGLSELPSLLLTSVLIERQGRKVVLMVNFLGSALSAVLLVFADSRVPFLLATGLTYFFIVGSWTALYVVTPELFPTEVRASAFGLAHFVGKLAGFLSPLVFGYLWDIGLRPMWIVLIIAGSFILAAFTAAGLLIETSGKRLDDTL